MSRPPQSSNIRHPCKDCTDRHTACHDSCTRYQEYKAERKKQHDYYVPPMDTFDREGLGKGERKLHSKTWFLSWRERK